VKKRITISQAWARALKLPLGRYMFSKFIGRMAPYSGTIDARIVELADGHAKLTLRDRKAVRNHLKCIHAVALMNLGEMVTGLAVMHGIDGRGRGIVTGLRMEYLKKARGTLTATCDVELPRKTGTYDLEVSGDLKNAEGVVVARAHATWKIDLNEDAPAASEAPAEKPETAAV